MISPYFFSAYHRPHNFGIFNLVRGNLEEVVGNHHEICIFAGRDRATILLNKVGIGAVDGVAADRSLKINCLLGNPAPFRLAIKPFASERRVDSDEWLHFRDIPIGCKRQRRA